MLLRPITDHQTCLRPLHPLQSLNPILFQSAMASTTSNTRPTHPPRLPEQWDNHHLGSAIQCPTCPIASTLPSHLPSLVSTQPVLLYAPLSHTPPSPLPSPADMSHTLDLAIRQPHHPPSPFTITLELVVSLPSLLFYPIPESTDQFQACQPDLLYPSIPHNPLTQTSPCHTTVTWIWISKS